MPVLNICFAADFVVHQCVVHYIEMVEGLRFKSRLRSILLFNFLTYSVKFTTAYTGLPLVLPVLEMVSFHISSVFILYPHEYGYGNISHLGKNYFS